MSSSTIEVMGDDDLQMVLVQTDDSADGSNQSSQFEDSSQMFPPSSKQSNPFETESTQEEMEEIDQIEPAGDIIFSPQDMMAFPKKKSNRGRKKKNLLHRRATALALTLDEGTTDFNHINVPVACQICGKIFANGKILIQHMSTHSEVKRFPCPHCPKSFTRIVHLKGHLTAHGIEKQFQCPICLQRFSRQDCVKVHMRLHDKAKCVFCDVCHKAFLTVGALNIHQRIHRGEKPFKCHLCGKCFTQKNHVITHIKRHTKISPDHYSKKLGPRIFQCEHCPRSFIRLSDYERHVQWNHGAIADPQLNKFATHENADDFKPMSINDLLPHYDRPKKRSYQSKVMCTTSTQTDQEGGHIIVPRKYQTIPTMTTASASTQVSAPPTPRAPDDEIYESDMFDEGMDRNYSSDEEENFCHSQEPFDLQQSNVEVVSHSTGNDEAFDAVLNNLKNEHDRPAQENVQITTNYALRAVANESRKEPTTSDAPTVSKVFTEKRPPLPYGSGEREPTKCSNPTTSLPCVPPSKEIKANDAKKNCVGRKFIEGFNISNWRGRSARGRGRGRANVKAMIGLTGATHLRLIRKSMMNYMAEGLESDKNNEKEEPLGLADKGVPDSTTESRSKRQAKNKACKTCGDCPNEKTPPVASSPAKVNVKIIPQPPKEIKQEDAKQNIAQTQTKKLLKFLVSGDATALKGTNFKLINENDEERDALGLLDYSQIGSVPSSFTNAGSITYMENNQSSIVSPPVELQSFCIPTFSCKLCGREFRFEGKLHRHIESVHQKKAIFSPDVKPGRGVNFRYAYNPVPSGQAYLKDKVLFPRFKKVTPENPEIVALRSEWDDGEDDNADADENEVEDMEEYRMMEEEDEEEEDEDEDDELQDPLPYTTPIVTKDITPVTNSITDVFLEGVKVNLNKLSGLAPGYIPEKVPLYPKIVTTTEKKQTIKEPVSALDTKCRKLLEKLFDFSLLMHCGINTDHVSAVLGRVLLNYGVKMIEDYGQGQYEVLKYNLWRLIEWKVTMEQMEEFYTDGKSVEEMMDDIMFGKVPIIAHTEPDKQKTDMEVSTREQEPVSQQIDSANQVQTLETVQIGDNQLMLSQLSNVLSGQLNLGEGVTQVVLAQDVSPELLQGAHIVTIDPTTGQVLSQVTAEQVILTATVPGDIEQPIQTVSGQVVSSNMASTTVVSGLPPGSILADSHQLIEQSSEIKMVHIDATRDD